MKKYIRSVVLICALNGVGVWADNFYSKPCATKIIDSEFGGWVPAFGDGPDWCRRDRSQQTCAGPDGAVGWTGYYCNDGPKRHHYEGKSLSLVRRKNDPWVGGMNCQEPASVTFRDFYPTKVLSKNPCSFYHNP